MPTQNEPRQKNDLSFSSMDDAPTNRTGKGQEETDWGEDALQGKLRNMYDEEEESENEDERNDIWGHGDWGERFD